MNDSHVITVYYYPGIDKHVYSGAEEEQYEEPQSSRSSDYTTSQPEVDNEPIYYDNPDAENSASPTTPENQQPNTQVGGVYLLADSPVGQYHLADVVEGDNFETTEQKADNTETTAYEATTPSDENRSYAVLASPVTSAPITVTNDTYECVD